MLDQTNDVLGRTPDAPSPGEVLRRAGWPASTEARAQLRVAERVRRLSPPPPPPRSQREARRARGGSASARARRRAPPRRRSRRAVDIGRRGGAARDRLLRRPKPPGRGIFVKAAANAWLSQLPKTYDEAKVGLGPVTVLVGARAGCHHVHPPVPTSAH